MKILKKTNLLPFFTIVALSFQFSCTSEEKDATPEFLAAVNLLTPLDDAGRISLTPKLEWSGKNLTSSPEDLSFDIYLGTSETFGAPEASELKESSYRVKTSLKPNTKYYWRVISRTKEQSSNSNIYSFVTAPPQSTPVEKLDISGSENISLKVDVSKILTVIITPNNASFKTLGWKSSDPKVATVTTAGIVTAKSKGLALITVNSVDGSVTDSVSVTVEDNTVAVSSIEIKNFTGGIVHKLLKGNTYDLFAEVLPGKATNKKYYWEGESNKDAVATVARSGRIQAKKPGFIVVKAISEENPKIFDQVSFQIVLPTPPTKDVLLSKDYQGNRYYIMKIALEWSSASSYASTYGGHLVHIDTSGEQRFLEGMIASTVNIPEFSAPAISSGDGGGVKFFWIGATDKYKEGSWVWNGDNDPANQKPIGAVSTDNLGNFLWTSATNQGQLAYERWGRRSVGGSTANQVQVQPNNYKGLGQNYGAISLDNWSNSKSAGSGALEYYGNQYEWNDIASSVSTACYFIIEIENGATP